VSGPSVSTDDSRQDYETPNEFMIPVKERFGPISFDLAAHAGNKKHPRYFAPEYFTDIGTADELGFKLGVDLEPPSNVTLKKDSKGKTVYKKDQAVYVRKTKNIDPEAYGIDAFEHSWSELSTKFGREHMSGRGGLLWDNCEWADGDRWSARHREEAKKGAHSLLLTHVAISRWFKTNVVGHADIYLLLGRMSFDGKNVYPKDCMLSHYHRDARGKMCLWDWRADLVYQEWEPR
jgi:hypothetical protein